MGIALLTCRQPIFDRQLNVVGYELLYRGCEVSRADFDDGDRATMQVILNTFAEIGLDGLVGDRLAFINLTRNFFVDRYPIPFPARQVVLEVLEGTAFDDDLVSSVKSLAQRGYRIALDDVTNPQVVKPLLGIAELIKIDLLASDRSQLLQNVRYLRRYHSKLLAEKVETKKDFDLCRRLGFDYFQGYFLCRPDIVRGRQILPSRIVLLRLMNQLMDPNVDYRVLEGITAQDVSLTYKLLRLANSASMGIPVKVSSIRQAISFLGMESFKGWLTLFLMSETGDKPRELLVQALVRARMCEALGKAAGEPHPETYFLVGLFSILDALMDLPMREILTTVRLSDEAASALLGCEGRIGESLRCTLAYEQANWQAIQFYPLHSGRIQGIYLDAIRWAAKVEEVLEI